jgi:hypothetical protein
LPVLAAPANRHVAGIAIQHDGRRAAGFLDLYDSLEVRHGTLASRSSPLTGASRARCFPEDDGTTSLASRGETTTPAGELGSARSIAKGVLRRNRAGFDGRSQVVSPLGRV